MERLEEAKVSMVWWVCYRNGGVGRSRNGIFGGKIGILREYNGVRRSRMQIKTTMMGGSIVAGD
jgi:hypothetical protein